MEVKDPKTHDGAVPLHFAAKGGILENCEFLPGTKKFPCLAVPLTRDKKVLPVPLSLCPGTRADAKIPGQTLLSRDKTRAKKSQKKSQFFFSKIVFFLFSFSFSPVAVPGYSIMRRDRLSKSPFGTPFGTNLNLGEKYEIVAFIVIFI